jgi:hypothetical protein
VSGSALWASAPATGAPDARAGIIAPGAGAVAAVANAPWPLAGATMTGLQDGRVLVLGTDAGGAGRALLYEPNRGAFRSLETAAGGPGPEHGAALLDDGTVLAVGGRDAGGAAAPGAWVIRPDLTGPFASDITIAFGDPELAQHLIPRDPTMAVLEPATPERPARYTLTSSGGGGALPSEWAILGGPVLSEATLRARVRAQGGGVALMLGFRDPENYVTAVLIAGQAATVYRLEHGELAVEEPCDGAIVAAGDLAPPGGIDSVDVALSHHSGSVRVELAGREVLRCVTATPAGRVGLGVSGASGASAHIDFVAVTR